MVAGSELEVSSHAVSNEQGSRLNTPTFFFSESSEQQKKNLKQGSDTF